MPKTTLFRQSVKNITDYLEKEQVDQVLEAAHHISQRDYMMLRVLWRTGVRINELLTIKQLTSNRTTAWSTSPTRKEGSSGEFI